MRTLVATMLASLVWLVPAVASADTETPYCGPYGGGAIQSMHDPATGVFTVAVTGHLPEEARSGHTMKVTMPLDFRFVEGQSDGDVTKRSGDVIGSYSKGSTERELVLTFDDSIDDYRCGSYEVLIKGMHAAFGDDADETSSASVSASPSASAVRAANPSATPSVIIKVENDSTPLWLVGAAVLALLVGVGAGVAVLRSEKRDRR